MAAQKVENGWELGKLSETLEQEGKERRERQERTKAAILRGEEQVPLTDKAMQIIEWVNRLSELTSYGSSFSFVGCQTEEQAATLEESIKTLRTYLNSLE